MDVSNLEAPTFSDDIVVVSEAPKKTGFVEQSKSVFQKELRHVERILLPFTLGRCLLNVIDVGHNVFGNDIHFFLSKLESFMHWAAPTLVSVKDWMGRQLQSFSETPLGQRAAMLVESTSNNIYDRVKPAFSVIERVTVATRKIISLFWINAHPVATPLWKASCFISNFFVSILWVICSSIWFVFDGRRYNPGAIVPLSPAAPTPVATPTKNRTVQSFDNRPNIFRQERRAPRDPSPMLSRNHSADATVPVASTPLSSSTNRTFENTPAAWSTAASSPIPAPAQQRLRNWNDLSQSSTHFGGKKGIFAPRQRTTPVGNGPFVFGSRSNRRPAAGFPSTIDTSRTGAAISPVNATAPFVFGSSSKMDDSASELIQNPGADTRFPFPSSGFGTSQEQAAGSGPVFNSSSPASNWTTPSAFVGAQLSSPFANNQENVLPGNTRPMWTTHHAQQEDSQMMDDSTTDSPKFVVRNNNKRTSSSRKTTTVAQASVNKNEASSSMKTPEATPRRRRKITSAKRPPLAPTTGRL